MIKLNFNQISTMNNINQFNKNIYNLRSNEVIHFFKYLNKHYSDYAVLGNLSNFPKKIKSDIDIYVNFKKIYEIKNFIRNFAIKRKLKISNFFQHEYNSCFFVLTKKYKNNYFYIYLDICNSYTYNNIDLIDLSKLKKRKVILKKTYYLTLNKKDNIYYYFVKKIFKGDINNKSYVFLKKNSKLIYQNNFINSKQKKVILNIFKFKNYSMFVKKNKMLKNIVKSKNKTNYIKELRRIFFRMRFKTGFHIAFIGVDGSGKSTQISQIIKSNLPFFFRGNSVYHLYNRQQQNKKKVIPYDKSYGKFLSLLKIFYTFSRFLKFYYFNILPSKMKSFLVINDRCHYDVMIDPRRFGIYHFYSTLNFIFKFLPKPDLVFFINSSAKNILNRSSELSKETLLDNIRKHENFLKKNRSIFNLKSDNTSNKISEIIISEIYKKINLQTKKIFLKLK